MKVVVISSSPVIDIDNIYHAYAPYAKELDIWAKYAGSLSLMCPVRSDAGQLLVAPLPTTIEKVFPAKEFNVKSFAGLVTALRFSLYNFWQIFRSMQYADHIHLRCPGNIGLMGCIVQIWFRSKPKTAKYAGNWDPKSKQPWSYRLQKWILNNRILTRNMTVLVYGNWPRTSLNIKPFFTATYSEAQKTHLPPRTDLRQPRFMFAGTLSPGKRPLYAIKLVHQLIQNGIEASLDIYGEGSEKETLKHYIMKHQLEQQVRLQGNHPADIIMEAYQRSHFLILPSISEGWPKVVAEAMFWGCVPMSTAISCVPDMVGYGSRGLIIIVETEHDLQLVTDLLKDQIMYDHMSLQASNWSRQFTTDVFEREVAKLLLLTQSHAHTTVNR